MNDIVHNLIVWLGAALASLSTWVALNLIGKPILAIREARLETIKAAERYGNVSVNASEERVTAARNALGDISSNLRSLSRGQGWPARLYCSLMRYDLENAARAINGLQHMAGEYADEQIRKNTINYVYYNLNCQRHLSDEDMLALRTALNKQSHGRS